MSAPLLLFISLISGMAYRGKIFFRQERVGKDGYLFRMIKFRTMVESRDTSGRLLPDEKRTTGYGRFLRESSLDELPQLWHILKGDMSLIGPRPLIQEHVRDCTPGEWRRHDVRPGLTGLAQVCGRNEIPFEKRFAYDVWYAQHTSLYYDIRIAWMTVLFLLRRRQEKAVGYFENRIGREK